MDLIDVIKKRRSIRRFKNQPIPDDVLTEILDCARLAPTAINIQPWLIGCVTDKVQLERLANMADHGRFIKDSAACFAVFCEKGQKYYLEDGCAATMNIITAAAASGIGTCWVAGDKKEYVEAVRTLLEVPDKYTLVSLIAAGYPDEAPEKAKKSLAEVSFRNQYK
ncbi:nitroreductase family protein [Methanocella arvoryzae]|uniref:Predicted nitroreductase n=1 Tax=Methanocella arvoryzae (strain DSM 22066 / NBRC 105507 / MRE50) TaxID=351160 RepID=Q0W118_METAR|nr:nitroreductase family protein [Methanocella arvoryzae]CAJ37925.1 predicted nitroreductase [Methanocella arvoryzae MRE50]